MNKLRRYFPLVILLLVLAFFLFPSQNSAVAPSADPSAAVSSDTLSLATSSPNASSRPTAAPSTPKAETPAASAPSSDAAPEEEQLLPEDGSYTTKEDVSLYLVQYGHLPSNFITKKEAQKAGWSGGSLEKSSPVSASAGIASAIMKGCSQPPRAEPGPNVTSTPWVRNPAVRSASSSPMMA